MGRFQRTLSDFYRETSKDIFKFCRAMNFKPTWQQSLLLDAVQKAKLKQGSNWIAAKSGQGPGKTTAAAISAMWLCYQDVDALTILTAPTLRQCRDAFLVECRRCLERADPVLKRYIVCTKSKVEIGGRPDWGIKLVTATKDVNAQGLHEKNLSVIGEEASGISRDIITQFKGTLSNPNSLLLLIGNPNTRDCAFFDCFHSQRERWFCLTFNAEDTARDYPEIVNPQRNIDLENEFGRDSDVYRIRVLGEFPEVDPNCVLSSDEVERVMDRRNLLRCAKMLRPDSRGGGYARQFGIDFARFGGDESVVYRRAGYALVEWQRFARTDPSRVVDVAFKMQTMAHWTDSQTWYVADATGLGQGVMHRFHDASKQTLEFHANGRPVKSDYANRVTEAWFNMRALVRANEVYLPKDNILISQLANRRYFTNLKGKLILEDKEHYMKRGFDSPDRADASVLAMYDDVVAVGNFAGSENSTHEVGQVLR